MRGIFNDDRDQQIMDDYINGMSHKDLMNRYSLSYSGLYKALQRAGKSRHRLAAKTTRIA
jgi:Mor family transcriptional regulator